MSLRLQLLDEPAAEAIAAGKCPPGRRCAADYPAEGDRISAQLFRERCAAGLDPRPFGAYLIILSSDLSHLTSDELVIGGVGFHGGLDDRGRVEIGYGIVRSQQGRGHATEAVGLLVELAKELGARTLLAETTAENLASKVVLRRHGFEASGSDASTAFFARSLG